jgi:hypothetical protein
MPKYRVTGVVAGGKCLGVFEAATPEEAEELALDSDAAHISLCHQCASECEDPQIDKVIVELVTDNEEEQ